MSRAGQTAGEVPYLFQRPPCAASVVDQQCRVCYDASLPLTTTSLTCRGTASRDEGSFAIILAVGGDEVKGAMGGHPRPVESSRAGAAASFTSPRTCCGDVDAVARMLARLPRRSCAGGAHVRMPGDKKTEREAVVA